MHPSRIKLVANGQLIATIDKYIRADIPDTEAELYDLATTLQVSINKNILLDDHVIGKVLDYFHLVEFQSRDLPHLHSLIWIEDASQFNVSPDVGSC